MEREWGQDWYMQYALKTVIKDAFIFIFFASPLQISREYIKKYKSSLSKVAKNLIFEKRKKLHFHIKIG